MELVGVQMHPLGDFINQQKTRLQYTSFTKFAEDIGVDKSTLSLWMSEDHPVSPSYELLAGLARVTKIDICSIIALVDPDITKSDAQVQIFARMIADLTPDEFSDLDTHLLALRLKRGKKRK